MRENWTSEISDHIECRVRAGASSNRIEAQRDAEGKIALRIYVTKIAEGGKANEAVIALLSKEMKMPRSAFTILRGETSRDKVIAVARR